MCSFTHHCQGYCWYDFAKNVLDQPQLTEASLEIEDNFPKLKWSQGTNDILGQILAN